MIGDFIQNYKITKEGKVFNKYNKELKQHLRNGYFSVCLSNKGSKKTFSVHQIMMFNFKKIKSTRLNVVNHIDGNRKNNNLANLELISQKENVLKAFKTGQRKIFKRPIIQYDLNNNFICEYESMKDAERKTNISNKMIVRVCKGYRKQTHGYIWKYKNQDDKKDINLELYKEITEYPNYLINKYGEIYTKLYKKIMKPYKNRSGYCKIKLCNNGLHQDFYIHRLVIERFGDEKNKLPNKNQVNHKNGIRDDNCIDNLEWVNCSENVQHSHDFLRKKYKI